MLIHWIVVLLGVSTRSSFVKTEDDFINPQNDSSLLDSSSSIIKPKRELDDFDFDSSASVFDTSGSIFQAKKINDLSSFSDDEDISSFLPSTSFKVTRSNSQNIGTHGQNFDSSDFNIQNFRSNPQKSSDSKTNAYSNGNQDASNSAFNNQVTTPFFDGFLSQPKYVATKSSTSSGNNPPYKPSKVQFDGYPSLTEYTTSSFPVYSHLTQVPVQSMSQNSQYRAQPSASYNIPYRQFPQASKNLQATNKLYAPLHNNNQQHKNYGPNPYDNIQFTTTPTVEINGKKLALPVLQLQTTQPFPYIQTLETTPVIFSAESGLQYKTEPGFGVSFDFGKPKNNNNQRIGNTAPFLDPLNARPLQVLPVQTASSTAQFPKFKGASVAQYPSRGFSKIPNDYQEFKSQAQLHFNGNPNIKSEKSVINSKPLEEIRADVEIIDKKKPIPPLSKGDDDEEEDRVDDDSGEGYKNTESYFPKSEDNNDDADPQSRTFNFKDSDLESDFKPSTSFPFKNYDFDKKKKPSSDDEDNEDTEEPSINLAAKYLYSANNDDEVDEDRSSESKPSKYRPYAGSEERFHGYHSNEDDKDEEESQKQEKREKIQDSSERKTRPRKEHTKSYSEEFDESFKSKPSSKPKRSRPRSSKSSAESEGRRSRSHSSSNRREESPSKSSKKNRRNYRDESDDFSASTGSPHPAFEDFDTSNFPALRFDSSSTEKVSGQPSYSKEEVAENKSYQEHTTKPSHKSTIPVEESIPYDVKETSTFNPRSNWKATGPKPKPKPIHIESFSRPHTGTIRALVHARTSYLNPEYARGHIFRNIKGI